MLMLTLNTRTIRFLSRMGARGSLGQAVYDYAKDGNDFFAVSADLAHASGFDRIMKEFPDHFVDVGIAEQNLIGISAGLARTGIPVIATTWAMFATVRVADQIRNFMGYMQNNVKLIGMDSGFVQSRFSYSHSNPPDIALIRAIPGITILSPCDGLEIYLAVYAALKFSGPVYIRLTGSDLLPIIHKNPETKFEIGKSIELLEGEDVAIVATGNIVKNALDAARLLEKDGLSLEVVDMHTIRPLDQVMLNKIRNVKLLVTVEEHFKSGGFGSAIAEYYCSDSKHPRILMLGVNSCYPPPGRIEYTERYSGLAPDQIADTIRYELQRVM